MDEFRHVRASPEVVKSQGESGQETELIKELESLLRDWQIEVRELKYLGYTGEEEYVFKGCISDLRRVLRNYQKDLSKQE
jgi:hypothetical protein